MDYSKFLELKNVNSLIQPQEKLDFDEVSCSIVTAPGNHHWVGKDDFVIIIPDLIKEEDVNNIFKSLIDKNIKGCCIVSSLKMSEIDINLCKTFNLPLFSFDVPRKIGKLLSILTDEKNIVEYLHNQLKNNILCIMNGPCFNENNLTKLIGIFLNRETYLLSSDFTMLCQENEHLLSKEEIPLLKWSEELSTWNSTASYSLEPVSLHHEDNTYLCFPLKSETTILGYLCIQEGHKWGDLNTVSMSELLSYFIICLVHYSKTKVFRRKSFEEFLQSVLYGFIDEVADLKKEASNHNFEYYLERYVWIIRVEPIDGMKKDESPNIMNQIVQHASNISEKLFYKNIFLKEGNQVISIQIKDDTPDDVEWPKYLKILETLELQYPEYRFCIGFSRAYPSLNRLKNAYDDAVFSVTIGRQIFTNKKNIFNYNDLLIFHLLYNQLDNPIVVRIYSNTVKLVAAYDSQKNDVLLKTLKALIENNFNYKVTADSLFIHRNTLYQRLSKIESIIGMLLVKSETRLMLQLGVKYSYLINNIDKRDSY
jgi:sugar diacid utilization regulator